MEERAKVPETPEEGQWSRRQFVVGSGVALAAGAVAVFGGQAVVKAARAIFGSPVEQGNLNVYGFDFYYVPNYLTWRVGDQMNVLWTNQSTQRWHEWTIGRNPKTSTGLLGTQTADGWTDDFWNGVQVTLSDPYKVDNFVPNQALVTYKGPKSAYNISDGGSFSPTLAPGGHILLSFVVPNKPGIWHYGCFVQDQEHYRLGMRGTIQILPA